MNNPLLDSILKRTVDAFDIDRPKIAIDATGHSCDYSSTHYEKRTGKERKNFTKNTIVIDTDNQVILSFMVHKGPRHDMKDAIPALRKMMDFHPSLLTADKGYDAEAVHEFTINVMHAECMIPQRIGMAKTGKHRKRMLFGFDEIVYHQRSKVETVFSVIKRVFGDENTSRNEEMRNKETMLRNICYNLHRQVIAISKCLSIVFEGFYRAKKFYMSTNTVEGIFVDLRTWLRRYKGVCKENLHRFVSVFQFNFNHRFMEPMEKFLSFLEVLITSRF